MKTISQLSSLENRVALITGGAGHLGRAMGAALAELGAAIVVADINGEAAAAAARDIADEYGVKASPFILDVEDQQQVAAAPDWVREHFGGLNILINNAAFYGEIEGWGVPFGQETAKAWQKVLGVNLTGAFMLAQACAPLIKESTHGSIINISSLYALLGPDHRIYDGTEMCNPAVYSAGKAGTLQMSRWLATMLAPDVRVNSITPGGIFRDHVDPFHAAYCQRTPMKRMATEEDFKGVAAYLASDLSAYVTGQNLVVDGGWSAW